MKSSISLFPSLHIYLGFHWSLLSLVHPDLYPSSHIISQPQKPGWEARAHPNISHLLVDALVPSILKTIERLWSQKKWWWKSTSHCKHILDPGQGLSWSSPVGIVWGVKGGGANICINHPGHPFSYSWHADMELSFFWTLPQLCVTPNFWHPKLWAYL